LLQIALRWRIENEVVAGKGQFMCGNKVCSAKDELKTWEVNFAYLEHGEKKNALVKLSKNSLSIIISQPKNVDFLLESLEDCVQRVPANLTIAPKSVKLND
jgi:hypothetical protein